MFVGLKDDPVAFVYRRDILEIIDDRFKRFFGLWEMWHNGFGLPYEGGWMKQPVLWIEAIKIMEAEWKKYMRSSNNG